LQSGERPGYHLGTLFLLLTPEQPMLVPIQNNKIFYFFKQFERLKIQERSTMEWVCGCPFMLGKPPLVSIPSLMGSSKPIPLG
jgi:hypothetical protein